MTVPFKPELTPWLADWIGRTQADATRVAPQTPQLPPVPTIGPDNAAPGAREALRQAYDNPQANLGRAMQAAQVGAEFLPSPFGDVASAGAAVREARAGNPGMAALSAAGVLPMVPSMAATRKAAKLIGKDANEDVLSIAEAMIRNEPMPRVTQVDAEKAARMAKVYEGLPKFDPEAKAAYDLLNEEVAAQAKAIQDAGYRFEFVDSDPYANSAEMMKDVRENKRLKVFKTPRPPEKIRSAVVKYGDQEFDARNHGEAYDAAVAAGVDERLPYSDGFRTTSGRFVDREEAARIAHQQNQVSDSYIGDNEPGVLHAESLVPTKPDPGFHPYMTPEQNDTFRAVHDWIAHAGPGNQFGPIGEENAYRMHAATLSPQAQRALASETRGQNSWVNFGPNAHLPVKERPFAEQKAALWPEEWLGDYDKMPAGEAEKIASAALRTFDGKVFSGPSHLAASTEAGIAGVLDEDILDDGFLTSTGRFVSREEAFELAKSAGQKTPRLKFDAIEGKRVPKGAPPKLIARGMDYDQPAIEAPQLNIGSEKPALDESNLKLVPDYVTDPMERAPTYRPPRADLSQLDPMWKRVRDVFAKNADQGLKEGLGKWYDVSPLRQAFLDESPTGQEDFELAMKLLGPTSSGTTTPSNVKQGSLMYFLSGDPVNFLDNLRAGNLDFPQGYANRRQASVNRGVRRILEEGNLSMKDQPKTFRYGNIPTGRYFHSVPLDMHVGRQVGRKGNIVGEDGSLTPGRGFPMPSYAKDKKVGTSPSKTSYAKIEDHILAEAEKRGVPGAPFMAAGWEKGGMPDAIGGPTGVADIRGLIPLFNERIALTAKQRGISRAEALRGFILKKWPLAAIGGLGARQGLLMSDAHSDDGM